jgi:hypothetical protein
MGHRFWSCPIPDLAYHPSTAFPINSSPTSNPLLGSMDHASILSDGPRYPLLTRLSFNVHGVLYVGDDEHIAPVESEIRDLSSGLQMVKDEQAYLVVRERVHRNSECGEARRVHVKACPRQVVSTVSSCWFGLVLPFRSCVHDHDLARVQAFL